MNYYIDGINLKSYGVYVSASKGIVNRPKMKSPASESWDDAHGVAVDLQRKYLEQREITLQCFIKASSISDFMTKVTAFEAGFDTAGTNRLVIDTEQNRPLIYEVYCASQIDVEKTWNDGLMVGTFSLKLIEPEPVKRILYYTRTDAGTATCRIDMDTNGKTVNIYWGDGAVDYDVVLASGENITHTYTTNGAYYPLIAGDIDTITDFSTNATMVWNKL